MIRLVRAELLKLRTTRTTWGLLVGLVPFVALNTFTHLLQYLFKPQPGQKPPPPLTDPAVARAFLSGAISAKTLVLLLGILMITTEFRHQTATPTFLASPRRSLVVAAKLLAAAIVGLTFAIVAVLVAITTSYICYAIKGETFDPGVAKVPQAILGILLVITMYAVIGIGVGTLLKNQVAALLVALGWTLAGEFAVTLLLGIWSQGDKIYRWFPGNSATAITSQYIGGGDVKLLSAWAAALVLVGYALVFAYLGSVLTLRRDVT